MRQVFFIIILFLSAPIMGQSQIEPIEAKGFVTTFSKEGLRTDKECVAVRVYIDKIIFITSKTTYQVFYKLSGGEWVDGATDKITPFVTQKDGLKVFHKSDKKKFVYE
jgi:hypothetical protein